MGFAKKKSDLASNLTHQHSLPHTCIPAPRRSHDPRFSEAASAAPTRPARQYPPVPGGALILGSDSPRLSRLAVPSRIMAWPYQFLDSTPEERHQRRLVLDRYGFYAQLVVLIPFTIALVYRVSGWASKAARSRYGTYDAIPDSPSLKSQLLSAKGTCASRLRQLRWWLGDDVFMFVQHWGQRDQWIFGSLWASLLLVLSVLETGTGKPCSRVHHVSPHLLFSGCSCIGTILTVSDYLHVTKRFAIVATTQKPNQNQQALKYLNPFAFVFRSSHEVINRWPRVLGRIIYMLLCLHAAFYLNFFVAKDQIRPRLPAPIVVAGVISFLGLTVLGGTALSVMRNYSYRLFFIAHLLIAFALPPILFFHAKPARYYVAEAFNVLIVDLTSRKMYTVTSQATCELILGTSLIKISAPVPSGKANRFREQPGSHVYVSIPPETQMSPKPFSLPFLYNTFTVAAVDDDTGDLTLVARQRGGPMTSILARHAGGGGGGGNRTREIKIPLNIEWAHCEVSNFLIVS